ncbi:phosphotransferase [Georgenia subflava]|uniref:Aminoglycoside phosphotransferase domain-containing protein n=1 Tax=Georgenia subflava TaxID=1622177 RepID=A0A6N7EK16_9MICO|nr:hypothetical protein [Georgenia subflava]MPV37127.1 hypothetical protein [Georgenia subflava]
MRVPPPPDVLRAFGVDAEVVPLPGGGDRAWRGGRVMLKPLDMSVEALEWQASVLGGLDGATDIRVSPPQRATDGRLAVAGWSAWRFEPGRPATGRWTDVLAAGRTFHHHLRHFPQPSWFEDRDDVWARADRIAWGDEPPGVTARYEPVDALLGARRPAEADRQLVHGDLTENVLLEPGRAPLVIDLSPCWRPVAYASAIVVVDAVVFHAAGTGLIDRTLAEDDTDFPQLLLRALLFRAIGDHLLAPEKAPVWSELFAPAVRAILDEVARQPAGHGPGGSQ